MEEKTMAKRIVGNDDRGQTSIEYLGIIAVVVAIVLVLSTTDFGSQIANAIADKISEVVGI
jgi:pilus assembly protein Flp/PilA